MHIYHDSQNLLYRNPFGAVKLNEKITIRISAPECCLSTLRLWINERESLIPMTEDNGLFSCEITVPDSPCLVWYYFILSDNINTYFYGNNPDNLGGEGMLYDYQPPSFQITVYKDAPVPEWYKQSVIYQIFPDRFFRGSDYESRKQDAQLPDSWKGPKRKFEEDWNKTPEYEKDENGDMLSWTFYGGTLKGIEEKIDYLKSYGVTAVYLNPVFKAASNHRYDTADYTRIDPLLGDEKSFSELCRKFRERNIRVILDGVFNHTGADSIYFDKYGNYGNGAYNNENSPYREWFHMKEEEPGYECWWGVKDLPDVEESSPSYREFICGNNGIIKKWLNAGASGWRLDVADELPDEFIQEIRKATKEAGRDNLLMGEVWEDASNKISYGKKRKYFFGDELDCVMNYPFRDFLLDFVMNKIPSEILRKKMMSLKENYPEENFYGSLNILDGHDRIRLMTILGEAENIPADQQKDFALSEWYYAIAKKRLKMVSAIQYASPGVPCIYYGDETGMQGHSDPHNRRTFPWGYEDGEIMHHYRMLGIIYKEHPVLTSGNFVPFTVGDDVYGFSRSNDEETILAVMNRHYTEHIKITYDTTDCEYALELLSSKEYSVSDGKLEFMTEPLSAQIILLRKKAPEKEILPRAAGIICHVGSLPGGKLGNNAKTFIDFLAKSGFRLWQTLPLNPVGLGNSPYHSPSVFAGNTAFINENEIPSMDGFEKFCDENNSWLTDYALYSAIKEHNNGKAWQDWSENERDRLDIISLINRYSDRINELKKEQYCFFCQWNDTKEYANSRGISIIGDIPIYVAPDSADLWAHREDFNVDEHGHLLTHAGVPPDSFTPEGQDWGNPLYNWDHMKQNNYAWWMSRFEICSKRFDYIRLDHFRSFSEYFSVPRGISPKYGVWQQGVGKELFDRLSGIGIFAEDLGVLDTGVFNLLKLTGLPGMNVWQFSANEMQEMSSDEASGRIFCSGTHDNHTLIGWYSLNTIESEAKKRADEAIEWLFASDSPWVILPVQDMLSLDDSARLNTPGTCNDQNWRWQSETYMYTDEIATRFRTLVQKNRR